MITKRESKRLVYYFLLPYDEQRMPSPFITEERCYRTRLVHIYRIRFKIFSPHVFLSLVLVENLPLIFKNYKFFFFFYAKWFARFKNQLKLKTKNPLSLILYFLLSSKTCANPFLHKDAHHRPRQRGWNRDAITQRLTNFNLIRRPYASL